MMARVQSMELKQILTARSLLAAALLLITLNDYNANLFKTTGQQRQQLDQRPAGFLIEASTILALPASPAGGGGGGNGPAQNTMTPALFKATLAPVQVGGQPQPILLAVPKGTMTSKQQQQQQSVVLPPQLSSREAEKAIVDRILGDGYDKRIRPAGLAGQLNASQQGGGGGANASAGVDGPTIVKVNTLVRSISKIDDVTMEYSVQLSLRQEWTDDRLAFGKMSQYKEFGLNSITLTEHERIWKPDLFFRNEKEGHFHKIIMPNVLLRIKGEGQVLYSIRISLVLACPMDLKYYPLDKQNCTIEMASYGYLDSDLKFTWKEDNPVQISNFNLPRFTLETYNTAYCTSRTTTGAYSCLRIDLIFKREFSYYLIQIYIPCCMLVIVSWVSFWLDPNAIPARVSLGVTTLLTMATQISGINASLPPVSYTKAIDVWTGVCLTFVFGALLEFALVNYASRSDQHKREMLTSALTHTQQMRWREATAAAAAAGVAPPTSPPPDENSPSMLARKQPAFFPGPYAAGAGGAGGGQHYPQQQQQHFVVGQQPQAQATFKPNGLAGSTVPIGAAASNGNIKNRNSLVRGLAATLGATTGSSGGGKAASASTTVPASGVNGRPLALGAPGSHAANILLPNGGHHQQHHQQQHQTGANGIGYCQQQQQQQQASCAAGPTKITPQINCALQYLRHSRDGHLETTRQPKRKNWCKMWLAKFPTRSKRIDVISRIFFPLKFALFNLVYWTTYLFREEITTNG